MDIPVVGYEPDLGSTVSGEFFQFVDQDIAESLEMFTMLHGYYIKPLKLKTDLQVARLHGRPGHVEAEDVDRRLGRPQHVLGRRDELDRRRLALGSPTRVSVRF